MNNLPTNGRNEKILFWASFFTLIAAGVGFSIRGAILGDWASRFGFTNFELGTITGGGLIGFGFTIIFFSFLADKLGYGKLMLIAFIFHLSSALVTLAATPVYQAYGKDAAYWCLFVGMFLFSLGNGTCEAVINPLTATLYPKSKTHWLNILHAGWPGGLILGALLGLLFNEIGKLPGVDGVPWEVQMSVFLVPTLLYGGMMFRRPFPRSEASTSGISIGTMLLQFLSPILLILVVCQALVGYVELGTDSWISRITGGILENKSKGLLLFIWTSSIMFVLRFFAGPIVHKISPLGLLFVSAVLGMVGLTLLGNSDGALMCVAAATIYGVGKTFFWPTMLGVVSERFPKGGALALGIVGGVGMLSAGYLGTKGIGYTQDYFASAKLKELSPDTFGRYQALNENGTPDEKKFLFFPETPALDGSKVATLLGEPGKNDGNGVGLEADLARVGDKIGEKKYESLRELSVFWNTQGKPHEKEDAPYVAKAGNYGGRQALIYTAAVPAAMAVIYLLLIFYFMLIGGYRQVHIHEEHGGMAEPATPQ